MPEQIKTAAQFAEAVGSLPRNEAFRFAHGLTLDRDVWNEVLDQYPELAGIIVHSLDVPDDVANRLSTWPDFHTRRQLASHRTLPSRAKANLIDDISPHVHTSLEMSCELELPEQIALLNNPYENGIGPRAGLKTKFGVHWQDVYQPSNRSPRSPYRNLAEIPLGSQSGEWSIKSLANLLSALDTNLISDLETWVARSGEIDPKFLTQLATSKSEAHRKIAAQSPFTDSTVLPALSLDISRSVRHQLRENTASDLPTLLATTQFGRSNGWTRSIVRHRFGFTLPELSFVPVPEPNNFGLVASFADFDRLVLSGRVEDRLRARFGALSRSLIDELDPTSREAADILHNTTVSDDQAFQIVCALGTARDNAKGKEAFCMPMAVPSLANRPDLARRLAGTQSSTVVNWIAKSSYLPTDVLVDLSTSPLLYSYEQQEIRGRLAARMGTLRRFRIRRGYFEVQDFIDAVCGPGSKARKRMMELPPVSNETWREILRIRPDLAKWVAINETVGPRLLVELADWPDPEVRGWVAEHPRAWQKTLVRLGNHRDDDVRRYAVYNARMPDIQLRKMMSDPVERTRSEAAFRLAARAYARRLLVDPNWWQHLGNSEI